jgi:hypothetical protein
VASARDLLATVRKDRLYRLYVLDLGVPPHVVREIVGRSAIDVPMTIYAHASLEEKPKALGKLGKEIA